jgi:DNA (cytosine-5)-methyltransferase 1
MKRAKPSVISLFSGAMGLDLGLEKAGFQIRVAVECNRFAAETIRKNRPDIPVIEKRIENITTEEILHVAGLRPGEATVVTGGPSCQAFSTAGQRASFSDPRGVMFREFLRVVREAQPRFYVMENVKGILSAAITHRQLKERGPGFPTLTSGEELGSALLSIVRELKKIGYFTSFDVVNAADFGVPQTRERVLFIGSREGEKVSIPKPTHDRFAANGLLAWVTLQQGLKGLKDVKPEHSVILPSRRKYMKLIPAGGNWRSLPKRMHEKALGGAFRSWGGRTGFLRRLSWDRPAPALTTSPDSKATMLCHPTRMRTLSVREYARLQQFPDKWQFAGGTPQKFIQIGNAVPVGLGFAVASTLMTLIKEKKKKHPHIKAAVYASAILIRRLADRPDTILNPRRMRRIKNIEAAKKWLLRSSGQRAMLLRILHRDVAVVNRRIRIPAA